MIIKKDNKRINTDNDNDNDNDNNNNNLKSPVRGKIH